MKLTKEVPEVSYMENHQANGIKFCILKAEGDGMFTPQAGWMKCKDFFNDVVARYHGIDFEIYRLNNETIEVADEGMHILLSNIVKQEVFQTNLNYVNEWAAQFDLPPVTYTKGNHPRGLLFVPRPYWNNTYIISLLFYLVRISNITMVIDNWVNHPTYSVDNPFGPLYNEVMKRGFKAPLDDVWYYGGKIVRERHEKQGVIDKYSIHNSGCAQWLNMLKLEGAL